ncbi:MAG: glutamine amidotransferase [Acidobacteriota bacterium]|nr:glutamine amidotransferase [Acidobacteriota bacterium]
MTELTFQFGWVPTTLGILLLVALGFWGVRWHLPRLKAAPPRLRRLLVGLRVAALLIVGFLLLYPQFVGLRYDPSRNYLLMLFDDSRSMTIPDHNDQTRGDRVLSRLEANKVEFENLLQQRYRLARYRFGESARRMRALDELSFKQGETDLAGAIEGALRDFQGIEVSAVMVFSDGIDQPGANPPRIPATNGVPVITVGTGGSRDWADLEAREVTWSRSFGDNRPVTAGLSFSALGLAGRTAIVEILEDGNILGKSELDIETDEEYHETKIEVEPRDTGWVELTARVRLEELFAPAGSGEDDQPAPGKEGITRNNSLRFLVDNRPVNHRLLYFSGRPNWENKFIQGAVRDDEEIELTSVLRISAAEKKFVYRGKKASLVNPLFEGFYGDEEDQPRYDEAVFLRFGGKKEDAGKGFPEDRAELFAYDMLILGDIEARFFSQEQLELVRDFVRKRGGTLLCLGGPNSFSEGKYADTVIAGVLPVVLSKAGRTVEDLEGLATSFQAVPTVEGLLEGTWALDANPRKNKELWDNLPKLMGLNGFPMLRPGATTLAKADAAESEMDGSPLFAMQRYGEGRSAIMATGSTWQWHLGTARNDTRHGRFWRQLTRGLCRDVPAPLVLRDKKDVYVAEKRVSLDFLIRDKLYEEKPGLRVQLKLTDPTGKTFTPGVEESLRETGIYSAAFQPETPGAWRLALTAVDAAGEEVGTLEEALLVEEDRREFQGARYNPERLEAIAEATGGRFFELEELAEIPDRIPFVQHQDAETVAVPFWHFPGFFIVLAVIMALDWYLRRKRGFA